MTDLDALRSSVLISSLVGKVVQLRRTGGEWLGKCPFHNDRSPSFCVNDEKGVYYCHGCHATGDIFDFVMAHEQVGFAEAMAIVAYGAGLSTIERPLPSKPPKGSDAVDRETAASLIWRSAHAVRDTPADLYLRNRGIHLGKLPPLPAIRFDRLWHRETRAKHPTLIASLTDSRGELTGIQRTYLTPEGSKLAVKDPKLSLGSIKGSAIKLGVCDTDLILCEGLEDSLSIKLSDPSRVVWATAGGGMMAGLEIPESVRRIVIAKDNDAAGEQAARIAAKAFSRGGRTVCIASPLPRFKDWNEQLQSESRL